MIDVLLAHSNYLRYDPKQIEKMRPYPPLATLYAAAILRNAGYAVALFDAQFADGEGAFAATLQQYRPRFVALYEDSFHFLVKMCRARMREAAQCMSSMARQAGATVIAAGPDVSDQPEPYFSHGVQYALLGEADHTLRELVDTLTGQGAASPAHVAGLAMPDPRAPQRIYRTPRRSPERHPDVFPLPAWDLVDAERYRRAWQETHGYFSLNMVTTRGCPYHCNWCAKPIWGQQYAMRSPAAVAAEMDALKRTLRPDHIWFADDIFGLRPAWVEAFAQEVRARDAAIPFMIQTRVDRMTDQAVTSLKAAGCAEAWLGVESGSQKVLDAMDKGIEVSEIAPARARLKAAGIRVGFFLQFGYPGETLDDIFETVQLVRDCLPDDIGVSVSYPLPGTRFYDRVRQQLGAKTHWTDSGDLAMMFSGTYRSPFYRALHRVLHDDLALRHRLTALPGPPDDALRSALEALDADWHALRRLEARERSAAPTRLAVLRTRHPAPDLSREWN